jgi:hypothetical protein
MVLQSHIEIATNRWKSKLYQNHGQHQEIKSMIVYFERKFIDISPLIIKPN